MTAVDTAQNLDKITSWLSPQRLSEMSGGLISAHQIRGLIDRAIADPESKLKPGVHYVRLAGRVKPRYKVSKKILEVIFS